MCIIITIILIVGIPLSAISFLLPLRNTAALINSALNKADIYLTHDMLKKISGGQRVYNGIPDIMTMNDGTEITTKEQFEIRKNEIIKLFEDNVYGHIPDDGYEVSYEIVEEGRYLDGKAIRRQVKIKVTTNKGSIEALMLMYLPVTDQAVGAIIGLNFLGNHTVSCDPAIIPSYNIRKTLKDINSERGIKGGRWPVEDILDKNLAVCTMYYGDWAEDDKKKYVERLISLFDDKNFGAISAWSFGLIRGVDYLIQDNDIDNAKIIDIGHSRLGKTALWAGANDTRISLVIANGSGNSGAALSRQNCGETVKYITTVFPYWFTEKYKEYGNNEENLPLDQHMLLSVIAPRKLYVGNAVSDLWADPIGSFNSLKMSLEAYKLFNLDTINNEVMPEAGNSIMSESTAFHLREGGHDITGNDWKFYLEFIEKYL